MNVSTVQPRSRRLVLLPVRFVSLVILVSAFGCGGGQDVTPEAIEQAKRVWKAAGIRDYELELNWTTNGTNHSHYVVGVKDAEVREIESVQADGRRVVLHPGMPRYFSVEGLYLTMADELALRNSDRPFGQPDGTKVVMRFKADTKLGYPLWYRRDVLGTSQAVNIEVVRLTPAVSKR
jgi:hypothetical protein